MILHRLLSGLLTLMLGGCYLNNAGEQGTSPSISNPTSQNQRFYKQPVSSGASLSESKQEDSCLNIRRPLNPDSTPQPSETTLDRYFRLAYDAETEGNFYVAIANYRRAVKIATCACDREHALAGERAAREANALFQTEGSASKPTQFFWNRLQELTRSLSCVIKR